jgi:acyl carrier protein
VGEVERAVAGIWAELLKVERVGRRDNFFELGGHSLLAARVVGRLEQEMGVDVTIGDLFERPVLALLAEHIINLRLGEFDADDLAQMLNQMRDS